MNLKHIEFDYQMIDLRSPLNQQQSSEYLAINPQGLVPALETKNGLLTQSSAIIEYINEIYPEPPLLPKNPFHKAQVRALSQIIACDIHPLNNLRVLNYCAVEYRQNEQEKMKWYQNWIHAGFQAFEKMLLKIECPGQVCFGANPTIADIFLIPQVYNAIRFDCNLENYPLIQSVYNHCTALDAFIKAAPENQPACATSA